MHNTSHTPYPGVQGKCYIVTGASSGVGKETSILLSRLGAQVILVGRDAERLAATRAMMEGDAHLIVRQDLCAVPKMRSWVNDIVAQSASPLAGIAHCAGTFQFAPLRVFHKDTFAKMKLCVGIFLIFIFPP